MDQQPPTPGPLVSQMEALSDPTRLRLLRLLERQELGVTELTDVLQLPQSTVSRHLKLLADQAWITSRSHGTANFYELQDELPAPARRLWQLVREQTEGWATVRQDELRLKSRLQGRETSAEAFFARSAEGWDKLRQELYGRAFSESAFLELLPSDWVVADLACGTGAMTAALGAHVARVIGVDQSAAMLRAAKKRVNGNGHVELRQGPLEHLPLEDGSCDGALLVLALGYVDEPQTVLAEAARILRPGGRLVVVDLLRHDRDDFRRQMGQQHPGFEPEALVRLMTGAGLERTRARPLPPEAQAKGPALVLASAVRPTDSVKSLSRSAKREPERKKR